MASRDKSRKKFHIGDRVSWNSEAGHVSGTITGVHTKLFKVNGYTRHASKDNPQYTIKSNKTDHVAHHFGKALHKAQSGIKIKPSFEEYYNTVPKYKNDTSNYDLRAAYNNLPYEMMEEFSNNPEAHLPDTYKLPNHPTFSNESVYFDPLINKDSAGYWKENMYIPYNPKYRDTVVESKQFGGVSRSYNEGIDVQQGLLNSLLSRPQDLTDTNVGNTTDDKSVSKEVELRGYISSLGTSYTPASVPVTSSALVPSLYPTSPADNTRVPITRPISIRPSTPGFDYAAYAEKFQKYLDKKHPDAPVTGEDFAKAAIKTYKKTGIVVPPKLAIAQAELESNFGTSGGRPTKTKNIYNVGNIDSGANKDMGSWQTGINSYYSLIANSYLKGRSVDDLLNNFVNTKGQRYATDSKYESKLKSIISGLNMKDGGIALTPQQKYEGLNNSGYSEMFFPMQGDNTFRGLDSGEPVALQDEEGNQTVLYGPSDTATMKGNVMEHKVKAKSGIHIKKSHVGRFTAYKKRTGKTTEEALHSKDPHVRKMAQFAINRRKWHHQEGGFTDYIPAIAGGLDLLTMLAENNRVNSAERADFIHSIQPEVDSDNTGFYGTDQQPIYYQTGGHAGMSDQDVYASYAGQLKGNPDATRLASILTLASKYGVSPHDIYTTSNHAWDPTMPNSSGMTRDYTYTIMKDGKPFKVLTQPVAGVAAGAAPLGTPVNTSKNPSDVVASSFKDGGLSRKSDYGSKKKPYPSVDSSDFAGPHRSYPIPTKADAIDALRLAGMHHDHAVIAKVYAKYPDLKHNKQYGGDIPSTGGLPDKYASKGNIEAEAGEVYQDQGGNIQYLDPNLPNTDNHEEGGAVVPFAFRVLEATSTKKGRKDFSDKALQLSPEMVEKLTGFKTKGANSHAGALMKADEFYTKKRNKYGRAVKKQLDNKTPDTISLNTTKLNLRFANQIPTKEQLFDNLFEHQEQTKARFGIAEYGDKAQWGKLVKLAEEAPELLKALRPGGGGPLTPTPPPTAVASGASNLPAPIGPRGIGPVNGVGTVPPLNTVYDVLAAGLPLPGMHKVPLDATPQSTAFYRKLIDSEPVDPSTRDTFTVYAPNPYGLKPLQPLSTEPDLSGTGSVYGNPSVNTGPDRNNFPELSTPFGASISKPTYNVTPTLAPMGAEGQKFSKNSASTPGTPLKFPVRWTDVMSPISALLEPKGQEYYNPVRFDTARFQRLDPTAALNANQSTFRNSIKLIPNNPVGRSVASSLFAKKYQADQQVIGEYANQNAQIANREAEYNNQILNKEALVNQQARQRFLDSTERRDAAFSENRLNALDALGSVYAKNRAFNFNANLISSLAPYMELNPETKKVVRNSKKYTWTSPTGQ